MICARGMQGKPPCRPLWKAEADTGRADYFSFTFRHHSGKEYVVSIGKSWRGDGLRHNAGPDASEVLIFARDATRVTTTALLPLPEARGAVAIVDLLPSQAFPLLYHFDKYFDSGTDGYPMACHMQDSILESMLFCFEYYLGKPIASVSKMLAGGPAYGVK